MFDYMDGITLGFNSINNEILTSLALLLDNHIIFSIILLLIIFLLEKRDHKRGKLLIIVMLAFLVGIAIKTMTEIPRPCEELLLKAECGESYSFPSLHAITAFVLALGFLNKKEYPLILLFALFVSFSRIYLGVHTFVDIAGSLVLAPIVYGIVDWYFRRNKK